MHHYIEILASPKVVFEYIAELDKHCEWQEAILASKKIPGGATQLGTRNTELRKMPGGPKEITSEIVEYVPPEKIKAKTVSDGPIRATITLTVTPLDGGSKSGLRFSAELTGIGIGKLFVLIARKNSQKQIPKDLLALKQRIENLEKIEVRGLGHNSVVHSPKEFLHFWGYGNFAAFVVQAGIGAAAAKVYAIAVDVAFDAAAQATGAHHQAASAVGDAGGRPFFVKKCLAFKIAVELIC